MPGWRTGGPLRAGGGDGGATGELLAGATFVPEEDTVSYLRLLQTLGSRCGIPVALYMDCHSLFRRNDDAWTREEELRGRQAPTQVGRALAALGVDPIYALSPLPRGALNAWGTLQDRLVAELRLAGIPTVAAGPPGAGSGPDLQSLHRGDRAERQSRAHPGPHPADPPGAGGTRRLGWRSDSSSMARGASPITIGSSPPKPRRMAPPQRLRRRRYSAGPSRGGDSFIEQLS